MRNYYFTANIARLIIEGAKNHDACVQISLDLNRSDRDWHLSDGFLRLENGEALDIERLEKIKDNENKVFIFDGRSLEPVEVRSDGYYKLVPTETVPTLEINGIKMHRSKDIEPFEDARLKAALVVKQGDMVLDTCGGLGYSAVWALKAGAVKVVSTEKNPSVLRIRKLNPWSTVPRGLELIQADITSHIQTLDDKTFSSIIHDPPRFSSATGDLYGKMFYSALFRVLKDRGRLFHYTGSPKKIKQNDRFLVNTQRRLEHAGFQNVEFKEKLQGFYAEKKAY